MQIDLKGRSILTDSWNTAKTLFDQAVTTANETLNSRAGTIEIILKFEENGKLIKKTTIQTF